MRIANKRVFSLLASYLNGLLVVAFIGAANHVVCGPAEACPNFPLVAPFALLVLFGALLVSLFLAIVRDSVRFLPLHLQVFFLAAFVAGITTLVLMAFDKYVPMLFAGVLWPRFLFPLAAGLAFWVLFLSMEVRRAVEALLLE